MQHNKITKNISELKPIISDSEKMTSSLTDVMNIFNLKKHFSLFNFLKSKGVAVNSLLNIIILLPFYGVASIYALYQSGIKNSEFQGKKDVYYDIKNSEYIDWRLLLILHVKRFKYLINKNINLKSNGITAFIFDDTTLEKTGKKIERISVVNDHVSGTFILGFKLLVCGFWDGASFIPVDFSLHREKGSKQDKLRDEYLQASKKLLNIKTSMGKAQKTLSIKENQLKKAQQLFDIKPNKTNKKAIEKTDAANKNALHIYNVVASELTKIEKNVIEKKRQIKRYYAKDKLFGLTTKERKEQFKKQVSKTSCGNTRRRETDKSKIDSMLAMLRRAVKNGFIANYVLCDSWFFCYELLENLKTIKNGIIKLVSMVKINNQIFTDVKGKKMSVKTIPELYRKKQKKCRKLKSQYIKVPCFYKNIRVNLFYVKMGKATNWHLLVTTDLNINFITVMEIYQIRWSIEVFFKESKQYLNLGNCKSSIFDAQVADITVSMMQFILLSYFKRINYMQSTGELFKNLSKELIEIDLVSRLLAIFWELVAFLCEIAGFDYMIFQEEALKNEAILNKMINLLPDNNLEKAA